MLSSNFTVWRNKDACLFCIFLDYQKYWAGVSRISVLIKVHITNRIIHYTKHLYIILPQAKRQRK